MSQTSTLLPTSSRVIAWPSASPITSPFGSSLPNRAWSDVSRGYRYGFNGKEKDAETANDAYDFGARIYDGRLGRWLSLDPWQTKYPWQTPYAYYRNAPIAIIDFNGFGDEDDLKNEYEEDDNENHDKYIENYPEITSNFPNSGRPNRGLIIKDKIRIKNSINLGGSYINGQNTQFKFRVRGKNSVSVAFDAQGIPDQLIIIRVRWFIFRQQITNTGMMTGRRRDQVLNRGRYIVRVIAGVPSPSSYRITITGQRYLWKIS